MDEDNFIFNALDIYDNFSHRPITEDELFEDNFQPRSKRVIVEDYHDDWYDDER